MLEAVCDAFLPSLPHPDDPHGLFATGARAAGTAARAERLIAALADPLDRTRLRLLLTALGSPLASALFGGPFASFPDLSLEAREAALRAWSVSRLAPRRAGFQALKRLVHVAHYCWPLPGGSHPAWRAVGYPGPLPLPPPAVARDPLPTVTIERDTTLECDVVVVGSGAGGGVAAGVLAAAGRDLIVLERGPNPGPSDFSHVEGDSLERYYLDGGLLTTQDGGMPILAGSCLGGGTVINYTTSLPLPPAVRDEWDRLAGLTLFTSPRFQESLDRVSARVGAGTRWNTPGMRDQLLERGCRALGWHVDLQPRNVTDCREGLECGFCGYGCRHGAKNTTASTYLADAARAGARLIVHCDVERALIAGGRATGVRATARGADGRPHALTVRAGAVVAACGAINTPALLARSGLANPNVGRHLRLHPAAAVFGFFPQRVEPWSGAMQTRYSDQLANMDGGYGVKLETAPIHFALPASGFGWEGARAHREDVARLAHLSLVGLLLRDRDAGHVAVSRGGRPRVHYRLSVFDAAHLRRAVIAAAEQLAAAGATEVVTTHTPPARARPGAAGWLEAFARAADRRGYSGTRMSCITFHQMGSARMGRDPARSVVDGRGESHEVRGLYVADGSAFPTSSGVNPMITIMAIADRVAGGLVAGE